MINEKYEELLQPDIFVNNFKTMRCFENWCNTGSRLDLEETLKIFEAYELYEYCVIIKKIKDGKL